MTSRMTMKGQYVITPNILGAHYLDRLVHKAASAENRICVSNANVPDYDTKKVKVVPKYLLSIIRGIRCYN